MQIGHDTFLFMGLDDELYEVYFDSPYWYVSRVAHLRLEESVSSKDCHDAD